MARRNPTVRGCLLAWLAVFGLASPLMAQPETAPRPAPPVRAERNANAPRDDLRYLHGPDGRLVPVLDKAAYDEFLKWQESREHPGPPASAITRLRLEGTAENDRVLLTARVDVTLAVDDEWVQVPLAFTEAQLVDEVRHTGPGEHSPGPFETDTGLSWWLRGKGKHELEVKLQAPATAKAGPRRLSLSLPHSAVGTCKMRIPATRITAKTTDRATLTTRPVGQETEVEIVGLEGRLELAWQTLPQVSTAPAALEVNTSVSLTLVQGEGATIEATQKIQTVGQQGMIERVRVRIPHGTEPLRLEGTEFQSAQPVDAMPDTYDIILKKGVPREVELRYTLHAPSPAPGEPFELDGFDVESATAQSGHVAVTVVGDLRAVRGLDNEKFIHRVNVSDLPTSLRQPQTSLAFRYFKRLKLSLRFEPVALQASVEPESMILIRPKSLELISLQKLQIRRGSLTKVVIHWPGRKAAGWSNPTITLPNGGEATIVQQDEAGDALEIETPEPLTGNVVLRLRSQRALEDPREKLAASLPICDIKERHPAVVSVYSTEDIETQLESLANTQLRPASTRPPPVEASGLLKREEQVVEPADGPFQLTAERHNRRALSKCVVAIRLDERSIKVNQRFDIDVEYAPLDELRLLVPRELVDNPVSLRLGGRDVMIDFDRETREWILPVDPARTGRIICEASYAIEPQSDSQFESPVDALSTAPVPLLTCDSAPTTVTQVSVVDSTGVPVAAMGGEWRRQIAPAGTPVWIHEGAVELIDVSLPEAALRRALDPVARASLRTIVGGDGTIRTRAQYRVAAGIDELTFRLPPGWRPVGAWWNSLAVIPRSPSMNRSRSDSWGVAAPEGMSRLASVVTLDLEAPAADIHSLGIDLKLIAPILPADRIPAETIWELSVPDDQYLMTRPPGFAAAYRWTRTGLGWSRTSIYSDDELRAWVGSGLTLPAFEPDGEGHAYLFHTSRGEPALEARFMNRLPLVLLGSGGILLMGLLITRMRRLHSLPVAVAAAAAVALAAVGWTEAVLTLLQPALLGAALLLFYLLVDSLAQRGRPADTVGTAPFPITASTIVPYVPAVAPGSHEPTSIRSSLSLADLGGQPSEGGSRP